MRCQFSLIMVGIMELGSTVAVLADLPDLGLKAGEVGTVVLVLDADAGVRVAFADHRQHTLKPAELIGLHSRGATVRIRPSIGGRRRRKIRRVRLLQSRKPTSGSALLGQAQQITPDRAELRRIRAKMPQLTFDYDAKPTRPG